MMRVLSILVGTATIGLAVACGYLYNRLQDERARVRLQSSSPTVAVAPANDEVEPSTEAELSKAESDELEATPEVERSGSEPDDAVRTPRSQREAERRARLQQRWADPKFRARALANATVAARNRNPGIARALSLDAAQEKAFIDLLAQQEVQIQEWVQTARAEGLERQIVNERAMALRQQHEQERAALLGQGRYQELQDYTRQMPEHAQLRELRSRLDEATTLGDAQAKRLLDAMYQERDSYQQQLKTLGNLGGFSPQYPIEALSKDRDPAARLRFAEEQLGRTEEFMGRLRLRASQVLSADQLRRFDEIQEEQLTRAQARLERMRERVNRPGRGARPPR